MNIVICFIIIAITGFLLMKRYQPQPILIGLGILMMVTMYPVLLRLGVSPVVASAVIDTGHLMDVGPGAVSTLLIAKELNMPVPNYFVGYQLRIYFLVAIVTAIAHFFWQKYRDRVKEPKAI